MSPFLLVGSLAVLLAHAPALGAEFLTASAAEIHALSSTLAPGDVIILASGTWRDQVIVFPGSGIQGAPLKIRAEAPGKTVLTGRSSLRLGGSHVEVEGLWFNECTDRKDVLLISGSHCRITDSAFTANRCKFFVRMTGAKNVLERCFLSGKTTESPALQIDVADGPNDNRIERNHFGPRPPLGRNGGETIRIGNSEQSMNVSRTLVQQNLFEGCDGEIEIISNKSCENIYRANTFRSSAGTLTLRHGNRCIVDGNFFLGDGKPGSGGVRVIGEDHLLINNYFAGLDHPAIWLTAGILDSPLNGYFRAQRCVIAFNTVVQNRAAAFDLDAGFGSSRRGLRPSDITIANNLLAIAGDGMLTRGTEGRGFEWVGNVATGTNGPSDLNRRFRNADVAMKMDAAGLLRPTSPVGLRAAVERRFREVTTDMDGQPRDPQPQVGADDISESAVRSRPLKQEDVGPAWMESTARQSRSSL